MGKATENPQKGEEKGEIGKNESNSKVPEGHHPRGTTLLEALRGNLPFRGLCGGFSESSAGSLRGTYR